MWKTLWKVWTTLRRSILWEVLCKCPFNRRPVGGRHGRNLGNVWETGKIQPKKPLEKGPLPQPPRHEDMSIPTKCSKAKRRISCNNTRRNHVAGRKPLQKQLKFAEQTAAAARTLLERGLLCARQYLMASKRGSCRLLIALNPPQGKPLLKIFLILIKTSPNFPQNMLHCF